MTKRKKAPIWLIFFRLANFLILAGAILLVVIFSSPVAEEVKYETRQIVKAPIETPVPPNTDFALVIPKINAAAAVFPNIDPFNPAEFKPVLKKGVAHANGTSFPGQGSNIYLFAHSTDAFFNVNRYNAVFYLIGKLQNGDEIDVYYKGKLFKYAVYEKKVVSAQALEYLEPTKEEVLTLQTCYPPGTSLARLIVRAR